MRKHTLIHDFSELSKLLKTEKQNKLINQAQKENSWFTINNIEYSISEICNWLTSQNLQKWFKNYKIPQQKSHKTVGLILSGNIPLVGFHDLLCVLVAGHKAIVKLSHKDKTLYKLIHQLLIQINPAYSERIEITEGFFNKIDAIIATGSNNSSRYFDYYFGKYSNIIRKNRNSIAIINDKNKLNDFEQLADDLFLYFGLGCRNASMLFVPIGFDFNLLFEGLNKCSEIIKHNKYNNNYTYQKAIMNMNGVDYLDNGFCLFTNNRQLNSPIGIINYSFYDNIVDIELFINKNKEKIQCVLSQDNHDFKTYKFGQAQSPNLWDYADNIDTLDFLLKI